MSLGLALKLANATLFKGGGVLRFTEALPASVTYSRTGAATALTVAGVVVPFAANAPQLTDRGLLLESAATNLLVQSSALANAAWSPLADSAIASNVSAAPDGALTAARFTAGASSFGGILRQTGQTFSAGQTYAQEIFAKPSAGTARYLGFRASNFSEGAASSTYPFVDLQTLATSSAGHAGVSWAIEALNDGWYSIAAIAAVNATLNPLTDFAVTDAAGNAAGTSQAGKTFVYWGPGVEQGGRTSYIPTGAAAATRGLPSATVTVPSGKTVARATYGASNTIVDITGLTPGATFDLVTGRPWLGLGNELKTLEWRP